jgi:4-amino-4-deoxy-L-arabinose transferase-like glycosyltransferase
MAVESSAAVTSPEALESRSLDSAPVWPLRSESRSSSLFRIALLSIVVGGFAVRLLYLATPDLDSDQAIFGLMAIHMLRGEFPIFQWGYQYMGTIESLVAAPLMVLFGPTRFALNLSPVLFDVLFAYAVYLFTREAAGRRIGLWALAFACFPPCFLVWNVVVARGAYSETLALGTLASYLACRAVNEGDSREERRALVAVGITLGLSFWTHLNTVIYGAAIVAFWMVERPRTLRHAMRWSLPGFLLFSAPFWIGSVESSFRTFVFDTPPEPDFWFRLTRLLTYRLPIVLGVLFDNTQITTLPAVAWLLVPIHAAALVVLLGFARSANFHRRRRAARLLLAIVGAFFVTYLGSPFSGAETQRYLIPLYTVVIAAPAFLILWLELNSRRKMAITVGLLALALQVIPTVRAARLFNPGELRRYRMNRRDEERLFQGIETLGLKAVYSDDYWDGARFTFDAGEQIVFATPFTDRNHAYLDLVDGAERPGFLFHHPPHAFAFEGMLRLAGAQYRKKTISGYRLFYDIEAAPGGGMLLPVVSATASDNSIDAPLVLDRDAATRWESLGPQRNGMWFQVDLGSLRDVAEVDLWPGFASGAPRGLRVETSADGERWQTVAEAREYFPPYSWVRNRPVPEYDGWVVARFPPVTCRWVRLTNLGNVGYSWVITELEVRGPGVKAVNVRSSPLAHLTGRVLADSVLSARLPGGVRHWQGTVIHRFDDVRDAFLVRPGDRLVMPSRDPLVVSGRDPALGVVAGERESLGDGAIVTDLRLDTDSFERRRPLQWQEDPRRETAIADLGAETEIVGVVVEHREAASSFPRGLVARTSLDGVTWSEGERLSARPDALFWSEERLLGASFTERNFVFEGPHRARFVELRASPPHPAFPWIVRKLTLLTVRPPAA